MRKLNSNNRDIFYNNRINYRKRRDKNIDTMKMVVLNKKFWLCCSVVSSIPLLILICLFLWKGAPVEWVIFIQGYLALFFGLSLSIIFIFGLIESIIGILFEKDKKLRRFALGIVLTRLLMAIYEISRK
ncbi:hypothetical protein [Oceanirhabdus sp. W0125-5]|uniref:hypothetical protein n=1 Tax=Oceanirhabdus sp. W0125-5 TaxID=2999116 RepID=UPI0022F3114D|nr:hypothetical protein [Oceanirhabdus sp. W0125-5]WBW97317.1 hypothetical protein OW730_00250 [Oceanirhabdus sp. W0125-5]